IIGHMGLFVYTQKGSIISTVDLPTTEIIEPEGKSQNRPSVRFFVLSCQFSVNLGGFYGRIEKIDFYGEYYDTSLSINT
ncbi:hypothetical protein RFL32_10325, partial [Streptococcus suis]